MVNASKTKRQKEKIAEYVWVCFVYFIIASRKNLDCWTRTTRGERGENIWPIRLERHRPQGTFRRPNADNNTTTPQ